MQIRAAMLHLAINFMSQCLFSADDDSAIASLGLSLQSVITDSFLFRISCCLAYFVDLSHQLSPRSIFVS